MSTSPRSLISTFLVRCLDSTTPLVDIFKISRLQPASVAEQAGLNMTWSKIPEDMFLHDVAHMLGSKLKKHNIQCYYCK